LTGWRKIIKVFNTASGSWAKSFPRRMHLWRNEGRLDWNPIKKVSGQKLYLSGWALRNWSTQTTTRFLRNRASLLRAVFHLMDRVLILG